MQKRIMFTGASGTGKTTLAKWVAEAMDIPFIETSTKPLWKEWGITTHNDILKLDRFTSLAFQKEVLAFRKNLLQSHDEYVCDRSFLDSIIYFLFECSFKADQEETQEFIEQALGLLSELCSNLIVCPILPTMKIEKDGKRITNLYFQYTIDTLLQRVLVDQNFPIFQSLEHKPRLLILNKWDLETRKDSIWYNIMRIHRI